MFPQALPGHHDGDRGFGDEVITEGAKQDTDTLNIMHSKVWNRAYPFRALRPLDPRITSVGSRKSIYRGLSARNRGVREVWLAYHFCNHVLGTLAMEHFDDGTNLKTSLPEQLDASI